MEKKLRREREGAGKLRMVGNGHFLGKLRFANIVCVLKQHKNKIASPL